MADREAMMNRVKAAKCYTSTIRDPRRQEEVELAAFMDIFHPDKPAEEKDQC